ncbi:anti-sigma factor antagonist [Nocardia thailandica]|uniref:Anti-sigma factor antagonist n=1 Tax=Nocardia thailandica TaxID=257275 RepID=A0ABW6PTU6_9NOCA
MTSTSDVPADVLRRFDAAVDAAGRTVVLRARGEVDAYTLPHWRSLLRRAAAATEDGGHLVIDLDEVSFLSARSVADLADLAGDLERRAITLALTEGRAAATTRRILDITGLTERLSVHRNLRAALAAGHRAGDRWSAGRTALLEDHVDAVAPVRVRDRRPAHLEQIGGRLDHVPGEAGLVYRVPDS